MERTVWQQTKGIMTESAQDICGMTKRPSRNIKTWWWNEEVAEAVREKKIKRVISSSKEKKQKEYANELNDSECQNEIF